MKKKATKQNNNAGYALIGMMGVMMFALILTTAAAPKLKSESQREKEEEMLWRGQQIATALQRYQAVRGTFPTNLKDLVKGIDLGTKKMRFLRPSALCDPMTPCTPGESNWRTINPGDPLVKELFDAYVATREKGQMILPPPPATLVQFAAMGSAKLPGGLGSSVGIGAGDQPPPAGGGPGLPPAEGEKDENGNLKGPIIGVVSRKDGRMFRIYYGLEEYDKTLFFPGVNVMVSGFVNPLILGAALASPPGPDPNCPQGGVFIDGKCWGNLVDGQCPPSQRGPDGKCTPK
jgi:type II secretory pathway pseudopilin PulG